MFDSILPGLKELWIQYGPRKHRRMIPAHEAFSVFGSALSQTIIKSYTITGNDGISKIGTKHAVLSCNPEPYLANFGKAKLHSQHDIPLALQCNTCQVKIWTGIRSNTTAKTFDQLRLEQYVNGSSIDTIPPISTVVRGHIHGSA